MGRARLEPNGGRAATSRYHSRPRLVGVAAGGSQGTGRRRAGANPTWVAATICILLALCTNIYCCLFENVCSHTHGLDLTCVQVYV